MLLERQHVRALVKARVPRLHLAAGEGEDLARLVYFVYVLCVDCVYGVFLVMFRCLCIIIVFQVKTSRFVLSYRICRTSRQAGAVLCLCVLLSLCCC